jgi:PPOX class probable F420-dependent enzyme
MPSRPVDEAGRIVVATYPSRAKTRNARRDPRVSALVLSDDFGGPWAQVDGGAEVIDVPEAVEPLVSYYRAIAGEHPDWAEYRAAMLRQGKSPLRVTPRRWGRSPPEASRLSWHNSALQAIP